MSRIGTLTGSTNDRLLGQKKILERLLKCMDLSISQYKCQLHADYITYNG